MPAEPAAGGAAAPIATTLRPPWGGRPLRFEGGPAEASLFAEIARHRGRYGGPVLRLLARLLPPDGVLVDGGAHIGLIAVAAAARVPVGHVHAIEPVPASAALLARNAAAAGRTNLTVHRLALAGRSGSGAMRVEGAFSAGAALAADRTGADDPALTRVTRTTLDEWADGVGLRRLDVLKLDIEGQEVAALGAGLRTLRRLRPVILAECNPPALLRAGADGVGDLFAALAEVAPTVYWLGRGGHLRPVAGRGEVVAVMRAHGIGDLLATPSPVRRPRGPRAVAGAVAERGSVLAARARGSRGTRYVAEPVIALTSLAPPPATAAPGEELTWRISLGNRGHEALSGHRARHPLAVGARWRRSDGGEEECPRAPLAAPLAPGSDVVLDVPVVAPCVPGRHRLSVAAVQEHYAWLDAHGPRARLTMVVEVLAP